MNFALFGDHPDGLDMARALVATGRHELTTYSGPTRGLTELAQYGLQPKAVGDLEEVLADPEVAAVIVAGGAANRAAQLRRALQSERHVLCVHPADPRPDLAYEAAMLQADTGYVLLPLLPTAHHPGLRRLAEIARAWQSQAAGVLRLIAIEHWTTEEILLEGSGAAARPGLPGWDVLRLLGGEIAEIFALTTGEELTPDEPLLLSGRYVSGVLLQASLLPNQALSRYRWSLVGSAETATLDFPQGWPGPALLSYTDGAGNSQRESWETHDVWAPLVEIFEQAVREAAVRRPAAPGTTSPETLAQLGSRLGWQDEVRALELDDAVRRSVERRRSSTLDFVEATEEASFKGTMTLVGCGLIWLGLVLLILSVWFPRLGWAIAPIFVLFLLMQVFRWIVPGKR
jgi:predicted dehydrogenase